MADHDQANAFMADFANVATSSSFLHAYPLQLHHSDHPSYVLSRRLLISHNYHSWRRSVEISLLAKNKIGFITGDIPRPDDPQLATQWDRCNGNMVIEWLFHYVEREIAESVLYCDTATKIWSQLLSRYSQSNQARIFQLQKELGLNHQVQPSAQLREFFSSSSDMPRIPPCNHSPASNEAPDPTSDVFMPLPDVIIGLN
ncbi:hypothetical protein LIER_39724 [Lithospermum erythrorhizon]|uniref:Retrotransposon Copia-like N-terminal domain-containing protein n=1 Tax=Lithospermum erythrorhizon TaxID=34254 RepID=A0AAV3QM94_LITER